MSTKWSIQSLKDRQVMSELDISMVQAVLSSVPNTELKFWVAKESNQMDWKPILSFKELINSPINSPEKQSAQHVHHTEVANVVSIHTPPRQRRKNPRIKEGFKVVLVVGQQTFRSTTVDLSLGGLQLVSALPSKLSGLVGNIFIYSPTGQDAIEFKAMIIADISNPKRIEFKEADERFTSKLQSWFDHISMRYRKAA